MPFGKHKGEQLRGVPLDYLQWLLAGCTLREPLRAAVAAELRAREYGESSGSSTPTGMTSELVGAWYRKLAVESHPDKRGGNHEAMKAVNRAREVLLSMVEAAT